MDSFMKSVKRLDSSLADYAREYPHVVPSSLLEEAKDTAAILHDEAAELWEKIAVQFPDDGLAQHHLAVIRHGSAFLARDQGRHDEKSFANWKAGLRHWEAVLRTDGFWDHLTSIWMARRDSAKGEKLAGRLLDVDLQAFRRALPAQLLTIHVNIIQDTLLNSPETAKAHIGLIRESRFDGAQIRDAVNQVYKLVVGAKKNAAPEMAAEAIEAYLKIDPQSTRALQDRLQAAIRICEDKDLSFPVRVSAMKAAQVRASTLKHCSKPSDADYDRTLEVLRDFFLTWGHACNTKGVETPGVGQAVNDLFREAFELVEQACDFERTGVSAQNLICSVASNVSQTCAKNLKDSARLIDRAVKKFPKRARLVVARARVRLYEDDFENVDKDLQETEKLMRLAPDPDAAKDLSIVRDCVGQAREVGSMRARNLLIEGQQLMNQQNWQEALVRLRSSRDAQPHENNITLTIIDNMHTCYGKVGNTSGQSECARDFRRLSAEFGER